MYPIWQAAAYLHPGLELNMFSPSEIDSIRRWIIVKVKEICADKIAQWEAVQEAKRARQSSLITQKADHNAESVIKSTLTVFEMIKVNNGISEDKEELKQFWFAKHNEPGGMLWLAELAIKIESLLSTSVSCEQCFSGAGRIIRKDRMSLKSETAEANFLYYWNEDELYRINSCEK